MIVKILSVFENLSFLINFQFDISPMISPNPRNLNQFYSRQPAFSVKNFVLYGKILSSTKELLLQDLQYACYLRTK